MGHGWQFKNLAGFCQLMFLENSWAMFVMCPRLKCSCGGCLLWEIWDFLKCVMWPRKLCSAQGQTLEGRGAGFLNCYYFYFLMKHLNPSGWVLWFFPLRYFVIRNFDGSSSYCRRSSSGVFNLLVEFHLCIHRIIEMFGLEGTSNIIEPNP